jgi:hypothetical protein
MMNVLAAVALAAVALAAVAFLEVLVDVVLLGICLIVCLIYVQCQKVFNFLHNSGKIMKNQIKIKIKIVFMS